VTDSGAAGTHAAPDTPRPIAIVRSYTELQRTVVAWCEQIGMTRAELDAEAGLTDGYAGKLLAARARKKLGLVTLGRVMAGAGLVLIVAVDPEFAPENRSHVRSHVQHKHWRRNRGPAWGRRMAALRTLKQSAAERSASARKAAQARWQRRQAAWPTPTSDAAE
jgi:hypothetical protein